MEKLDLTTVECVLRWAVRVNDDCTNDDCLACGLSRVRDNPVAAYIARAVRIAEAWDSKHELTTDDPDLFSVMHHAAKRMT